MKHLSHSAVCSSCQIVRFFPPSFSHKPILRAIRSLSQSSFLAVLLAGTAVAPCAADTMNWNGTGNWTDPGLWSPGTPGVADQARVQSGSLTVNTPVETLTGSIINNALVTVENSWAVSQTFAMDDAAELEIVDGGQLNVGTHLNFGSGTLTVDGNGSQLNVTQDMIVGRDPGPVSIVVENGGTVTTGRSFIGEGHNTVKSASLDVRVSGAESQWHAGSFLGLGGSETMTATFLAEDGALVTATTGAVGRGGSGEMTITDGAELSLSSNLSVGALFNGHSGDGTLTVQNNSTVSAAQIVVGVNTGDTGTFILGGPSPEQASTAIINGLRRGSGAASVLFDHATLQAKQNNAFFINNFTDGQLVIGAGGLTIDTNGYDVTATSGMGGTGGLTKTGAGTLQLTGNSSYAGGTIISEGTVEVSTDANLGNANGDVEIADATLRTTGSFTTARDIQLSGAGTIETEDGTNLTVNGDVTGAGSLTKAGDGSLTLAGDYSYAGGTTVSQGTLEFAGSGDPLAMSGDWVNNGTLSFARSGDITLDGEISGTGNLVMAGAGSTLTLTGASSYEGAVLVEAGVLEVNSGGEFTSTSSLNVRPFAEYVVDGTGSSSRFESVLIEDLGQLTVRNGGYFESDVLELNHDDNLSQALVSVTGPGSRLVTKELLGGLDGVVEITIEDGASVTVGTGAPGERHILTSHNSGNESFMRLDNAGLEVLGDLHVGYEGGSVSVELKNDASMETTGTAHVGVSNGLGFSQGQISIFDATLHADELVLGTGESSRGVLVMYDPDGLLEVDNTLRVGTAGGQGELLIFDGTATANQLLLGDAANGTMLFYGGSLDVATDVIAATGENAQSLLFMMGGAELSAQDFTLATGHATAQANVNMSDAGTSMNIAGTLTVGETGSATLSLSDGAGIQAGSVRLADAAGSTGTVTIASSTLTTGQVSAGAGDATFTLEMGSELILSAHQGELFAGFADGKVTITDSAIDTQDFEVGTGAAIAGSNLTKRGNGTLVLAGNNTYTGSTSIEAGTLQLGDGGTSGQIAGDVTNDGILAFNRTDTLTFSGDISGTGAVHQDGTGKTILTGINTYSGGTVINDGTLEVSASDNLGDVAGDVTINDGIFSTTQDIVLGHAFTVNGDGGLAQNAGTSATFTNSVAGTGSLTKSGNGTAVIQGEFSIGGDLHVAAGEFRLEDGANVFSVGGDIVTDGVLSMARSGTLTIANDISGNGGLQMNSTGTLVLEGTNSYKGATTVALGTLRVNGDNSAATGPVTVATNATLGGSGTIGGSVFMDSGSTLDPGNSPGTLTINGDLTLDAGSVLNFELGQANVPGGLLNDLINVGGNLDLNGTLNVTETPGGSFGPGFYRLFNYGGSLSGSGLAFGAIPADSDLFIQTAVPGQVNLINLAGTTMFAWDGDSGIQDDSEIQGGDGVWSMGGGTKNWTTVDGSLNSEYLGSSFVMFLGQPGTVTIDNSGGNVTVNGMQFAADGYVITGDQLTLDGPQAVIGVSDDPDGPVLATIESAIGGASQLVKEGLGTLALTGDNSYSGGTLIRGGTIQVAQDANLGDAAGAITFEGGALQATSSFTSNRDLSFAGDGTILTDSGTELTLAGALTGNGSLIKDGAGDLALTGDGSAYAGEVRVNSGTLTVNGTLGGGVEVASDGRLAGNGQIASLVNQGTVAPGGEGIGTLTIAGDYVGNGGRLEIDVVPGNDAADADRLVILGSTSGTTEITVRDRGGLGTATTEGMKIIDVAGASDGVFTLDGDYEVAGEPVVIAGAYAYRLDKGSISDPADGDWYLRSSLNSGDYSGPLYQPGVPVYEGYVPTLLALSELPTHQQRVGTRLFTDTRDEYSIWGRFESVNTRSSADVSTSGIDRDIERQQIQMGFERRLAHDDSGALIAGLTIHNGKADTRIGSRFGDGEIDANGYGIGATLTWYGANGFYADAQAQWSWISADLESSILGDLVRDNDGKGKAFSLELGRQVALSDRWSVTPQAQLAYAKVDFDGFVDPAAAMVMADDVDSLRTRAGILLDYRARNAHGSSHLYGILNVTHDWLPDTSVRVAGTEIVNRDYRTWGELGLGASYRGSNGVTFYAEGAAETAFDDFGDSRRLKGVIGLRASF